MEEDMDVNCGTILDGSETVQEAGQRIFERILRVASGERTKSELSDLGAANSRHGRLARRSERPDVARCGGDRDGCHEQGERECWRVRQ
jgi:hypothetical protein